MLFLSLVTSVFANLGMIYWIVNTQVRTEADEASATLTAKDTNGTVVKVATAQQSVRSASRRCCRSTRSPR